MSGTSREFFSTELCKTCSAQGHEQQLKELLINDGPLSAFLVRCIRCGFCETRAAAVGVRMRAELLKTRKRASTRAWTFMAIGALLAFSAIALAATALAALK